MEIRLLFSYGLLGTFLIFFSLPSFSFSGSCQNVFPTPLITSSSTSTIQQYLVPHNIARAKLGLPPLKWSKELIYYASWWAHQRQRDCDLVHSNSNYGENLFWGSGKNWKPGEAIAVWAEEKSYYDQKTNSCTKTKDCLRYTQMVWRRSLKVGCGRVVCKTGDTFITCNVIGQKPF